MSLNVINFNEMPFNRFAEVMRSRGEYSKFYLLNTLAAARAGDVPAVVKAVFAGYDVKQEPKKKPKVASLRVTEQPKTAPVVTAKPIQPVTRSQPVYAPDPFDNADEYVAACKKQGRPIPDWYFGCVEHQA